MNAPTKLDTLTRDNNSHTHISKKHTRFIKTMKIVLPLIALCLLGILFSWNILKPDQITAIEPTPGRAQAIGKNELMTPRFESVDDRGQPFTITAARALQNSDDQAIALEEPLADITLTNGSWLAIRAANGMYNQETGHIILNNNVTMFHDDGYCAETASLDIDIDAGITISETDIYAFGPFGTLAATAMQANTKEDTFIFNGPAKLILYDTNTTIP